MNKIKLLKLFSLTIIFLLLFSACGNKIDEVETFNNFIIVADKYTPYGTNVDTKFLLTTPQEYSEKDIHKVLSVEPNFDYTIKKVKEREFEITPKTSLDKDKEYVFKLKNTKSEPMNISFKTLGDFRFIKANANPTSFTFPIELVFNSAPTEIEKHIKIEPETDFRINYFENTAVLVIDYNNKNRSEIKTFNITIDENLTNEYGEKLGKAESLSYTVKIENYEPEFLKLINYSSNMTYSISSKNMYESFLTNEVPCILLTNDNLLYNSGKGMEGQENIKNIDINTTVYKMNSYKDFEYNLRMFEMHDNMNLETEIYTENFTEYAKFSKSIDFAKAKENEEKFLYLLFPDKLPSGHYAVKMEYKAGDKTGVLYKLIQISPYSYYYIQNENDVRVWLNDSITKQPLNNANVKVSTIPFKRYGFGSRNEEDNFVPTQEYYSTTDKKGISNLNIEKALSKATITMEKDGFVLCDILSSIGKSNKTFDDKYFNALYLDKNMYKPTDEISFFGVIKSRNNVPQPKKVYLYMKSSVNQDIKHAILQKVEAEVNENGTFTGKLSYKDLSAGYFQIIYTDDEKGLFDEEGNIIYNNYGSEYFTILDYVLPDFTYTSSLNKEIFGYDDNIEYTFTSMLYDGTPYSGKEVKVNWNGYGKGEDALQSFVTNNKGNISASKKISDIFTEYMSWRPEQAAISAESVQSENTPFSFFKPYTYFPSDIMLRLDIKENDKSNTLTIKTNKIDLSKIDVYSPLDYENYEEKIVGTPLVKDVEIDIKKHISTKEKVGEYYDPYLQEIIPKYTYNVEIQDFMKKTVKTDDKGVAVITDLPLAEKDINYIIYVKAKDGKGKTIEEEIHISHNNMPYGKGYYEKKEDIYTIKYAKNNSKNIYNRRINFDKGETIQFSLCQDNKPVTFTEKDKLLVNITINDETTTTVYDTSTVDIKLEDKLLPRFYLNIAYFDGEHIYAFAPQEFTINTNSVSLDIDAKYDKEKLKPGEEVTLNVNVKNPDNSPAKNTDVAVAVIDEKLLANSYYDYNVVFDLYQSHKYYLPSVNVVTSYGRGYLNFLEEGGKGGGGGDPSTGGGLEIRKDFRDSLGFNVAKTDSKGNAKIKVTIPESLTEWRFTSLCVSPEMYVGKNISKIKTTLPFFVKPVVNKHYLYGDEVAFLLESYGTDLKDTDKITYNVKLTGKDTNIEKSETANGKDRKEINFGILPIGEYKVEISAKNGSFFDGVSLDFDVIETGTKIAINKWVDLSKNENMPTVTDSPIDITLYSKDYEAFVKAMQTIAFMDTGRTDELIAKQLIVDKYKKFYNTEILPSKDFEGNLSILRYVTFDAKGYDGILNLYKNSGFQSIEITGLTATVYPQGFVGTNTLVNLLKNNMTNDSKQKISFTLEDKTATAAAIMGLYASNKEQTKEIKGSNTLDEYVLEQVDAADVPLQAKMYYIGAISFIDKAKSQELYNKYIKPAFVEKDNYLYIKQEKENQEVNITATALLVSMLTDSKVNLDKIVNFITYKQNSVYTHGKCALELAYYVNNFEVKPTDIPTVIYTANGKEQEISLDKEKTYSITLTKDDYEKVKFKAKSGNVMAQVHYVGRPKDNGFVNADFMKVKRTVKPVNDNKKDKSMVTYTINMTADAPDGMYTITEFIPTNKRLLPQRVENNYYHTMNNDMQNQKIEINFYYNSDDNKTMVISYLLQDLLSSKAVNDDIYIIHNDTGRGIFIENKSDTKLLAATAQNLIKAKEKDRDINEEAKNEYIISVADDILSEIIKPNMDDITKLRTIYDYIIRNNKFTDPIALDIWRYRGDPNQVPSYIEQRAISPMLFGYGMCEDYAAEFVLLARRLGFEAEYVFGMTVSVKGDYVDHAWAVVKLDNNWYHVDPQLEDNIMLNGKIQNRYFMRDDATMYRDHRWGENLINFRWDLSKEDKMYIANSLTPPKCIGNIPSSGIQPFTKNEVQPIDTINSMFLQEKNSYIQKNGDLNPIKLNFEPPMVINP